MIHHNMILSILLITITFFETSTSPWSSIQFPSGRGRSNLVAVTVQTVALFAGGFDDKVYYDVVDMYFFQNNSWGQAPLSVARSDLAATSVGPLALFGGGKTYNDVALNIVDIYDVTSGRWYKSSLRVSRAFLAATSVGSKALFGGGNLLSRIVDIYDLSTNQWIVTEFSQARENLVATSLGPLAFFAGGKSQTGGSNVVDIYNVTSNSWITASLTEARYYLSATSLGRKAFFGGGWTDGEQRISTAVDVYDIVTNKWSVISLRVPRYYLTASAVGNLVLFAGGYSGEKSTTWNILLKSVEIYNVDDNSWDVGDYLTVGRYGLASTTVGNKVLIGGGTGGNGEKVLFFSEVDIYTFINNIGGSGEAVSNIIIAIIVSVGSVVILVGVFLFCFKYKLSASANLPYSYLPKEISWSFELAMKNGTKLKSFFSYELSPNDQAYLKVIELFSICSGDKVPIESVYAVYSESLMTAFVLYQDNLNKRVQAAPELFQNVQWSRDDRDKLREWVLNKFNDLVLSFPWNNNLLIKILLQVHGTDYDTAISICDTGFAALALLDDGWYGKGIYFTSSALYAIPYYATKKKPTIILCYVIPGSPYPVIENPRTQETLTKSSLLGGSQSHYVVTDISGIPVTCPTENTFDELVINQEAQVVPAFIITLKKGELTELMIKYQREIVNSTRVLD